MTGQGVNLRVVDETGPAGLCPCGAAAVASLAVSLRGVADLDRETSWCGRHLEAVWPGIEAALAGPAPVVVVLRAAS